MGSLKMAIRYVPHGYFVITRIKKLVKTQQNIQLGCQNTGMKSKFTWRNLHIINGKEERESLAEIQTSLFGGLKKLSQRVKPSGLNHPYLPKSQGLKLIEDRNLIIDL